MYFRGIKLNFLEAQITLETLKQIFPVFQPVPKEQLQYLLNKSDYLKIKQDEYLFKAEEAADNLLLIFEGHFNIFLTQKNERRQVAELEAGSITGVLPFSRMVKATASAQATQNCLVIAFPRSEFPFITREYYALTEVLVHEMNSRIRNFTTIQQQNDRMMSLGKLSAGLAHELNNPAAAIARSSSELKKHISFSPGSFKKLMQMSLDAQTIDKVNDFINKKLKSVVLSLSMLEKQEKEDELRDTFDDLGQEQYEDLLENLVDFGFKSEDLEDLYEWTGELNFMSILNWADSLMTTEKMVSTIEESSRRIAELVNSIKSFTHMDQGSDKSAEDLSLGINSTLRMLEHKIKAQGILIEKQFDPELPKVQIWAGQMNQVYTNIIDNAIDALNGTSFPKITIKTAIKGHYARVFISDNGPGIPLDKQAFIFDAFFTTKGVGKGTGMGLEIARRIVQRHKGSLNFLSEPGNTEFEICLPI